MSLKNVLKGILAAFFVISGTIVAMPALATTTSGSCTTVPSPSSTTLYQMQKYFSVSYSRSGETGTATVKRLSSTPLCNDQAMVLQSFSMASSWNGGPDGHDSFVTSLPQTMAFANHFTFGKNDTSKTVTVKTPAACKGTQLDTYVGDQEVAKIVNIHDGENREIGGKIFQATGTCEVPVKNVTVCDASTGNTKQVPEADASKYDKADSDKCVKMQVCVKDSGVTTMQTITKDKFDTTKYSTNAEDCKKPVIVEKMSVCVKNSGNTTLTEIDKSKFDSATQSTNPEDCKKPVVVVKEVSVCDATTGDIKQVPETDKDKYEDVSSDKCKVRVCNVSDGSIRLVSKADQNKSGYEAEDSDACKIRVCDTSDHTVKLVPKADQNKAGYEAQNSNKCVEMKVCIKDSGDTTMKPITKDQYDSTMHSTSADACKKPVVPVTTTPTPVTPAPEKIASTGPETIIGGFASASALSYGAYSYLASRRAVHNAHRQ